MALLAFGLSPKMIRAATVWSNRLWLSLVTCVVSECRYLALLGWSVDIDGSRHLDCSRTWLARPGWVGDYTGLLNWGGLAMALAYSKVMG